jgi:hypothetical protein
MIDWQAKLIWSSEQNAYVYVRREIEISSPLLSAVAFVSCFSEYKLYVNGRYIGRGPGRCFESLRYYDEYDIAYALRSGKNAVAAICYNADISASNHSNPAGGFLLQLELISFDAARNVGKKATIITDENWKVKAADDWNPDSALGFREVYDSRRKPVGWNVVGFDDSEWEQATVIETGSDWQDHLVPRPIPPLREREVFPQSISSTGIISPSNEFGFDDETATCIETRLPDSSVIRYPSNLLYATPETAVVPAGRTAYMMFDFGKEVVGFPLLRIRDGGQGVIDLRYLETPDSVHQADRLILHGGRQEWQTFGRRALRYMELIFRDLESPLYIESVSLNSVGYPVEELCSFECSNDVLNAVWLTGVYTLSLCMQDTYENDPLDRSSPHFGHTRVQALMNYYSFFDHKLIAKSLREFAQQQSQGGFSFACDKVTDEPCGDLAWVLALHDYYLYTGDGLLVEELYPHLKALFNNYSSRMAGEDGLLSGVLSVSNAFYYQALREASKLAFTVGRVDDAVELHDCAEKVFRAFNKRFCSEQSGCYVAGSTDADILINALAVVFGLADSRRYDSISRLIRQGVRDLKTVPSPYLNFYLLQALARLDMEKDALDMIRRYWGEMLRRGASTWWKSFDPSWTKKTIPTNGLCAGASGAPTYFLPAEILGVKPSMPESTVVIIQPRLGDLLWAKGRVLTSGSAMSPRVSERYVEVMWRAEPKRFVIDIDAPGGFIAALPVGRFENPQIEEIDLSPETPERRARRAYGWGNVIWRDGEERDPYLDWLQSQEEEPPPSYVFRKRCSMENGYIWIRESALTHVRYVIRDFGD